MENIAGGIDVGSEQHHVVIMNDKEEILFDREVAHKFSEFYEAIEEFKEIEAKEKVTIIFAMEGKNGYVSPFDRILVENGFTLYNVDNLKLKRFKDVFGAEWRNDRRDAKMLRIRDYCPIRGLGEKPSPSGEDFSMLAVWSTTGNRVIPYTI